MARIHRKSVNEPDEVRELSGLSLRLVRMESLTVGYGIVQPGWRWSTHMRKETDEPLCQVHHMQLLQLGRPASKDRIVTTLLMTAIVDSTATASRLGDTAWKQKLGEHNRLVRARLERYLGKEVNTTGDGFLAMFASTVAAIRCAASIRDATTEMRLPVRIGIHTGEVELLPGDIGGRAVHAAARVMALGGASEIMVSSSTRGLVGVTICASSREACNSSRACQRRWRSLHSLPRSFAVSGVAKYSCH